jgi:uncharacterized membrane protein
MFLRASVATARPRSYVGTENDDRKGDPMQLFTMLASHADEGHGWWFPVFPLLWLALIVGAIWFFTRRRARGGGGRAREILAERYASGELTVEEYRRRLADLG